MSVRTDNKNTLIIKSEYHIKYSKNIFKLPNRHLYVILPGKIIQKRCSFMSGESKKEVHPSIRIKRVEVNNMKNVKHGVIDLCSSVGKKDRKGSDIIGIYGQNGTGKTTFVNAIDTIRVIMCGVTPGADFARFIDVSTEESSISVQFEYKYSPKKIGLVEYTVDIGLIEKMISRDGFPVDFADDETTNEYRTEKWVRVINETIKTNIYADGNIGRIHTIIDTKNYLVCGDTIFKELFGDCNDEDMDQLRLLKMQAKEASHSYVFCNRMFRLIEEGKENSEYFDIFLKLRSFARRNLMIIGTKFNAVAQLQAGTPLFFPGSNVPAIFTDRTVMSEENFKIIEKRIPEINGVLGAIVPGVKIAVDSSRTTLKDGNSGRYVNLLSVRNIDGKEKRFPFQYESSGIIRIVSITIDFIKAFNSDSATLVIDEMDAGVFEDLFGKLLVAFEKEGRGQLIFTAHNLHALEMINKKFIRFTSLDSNDRYKRIKNVGTTNNLRDMYLREIRKNDSELNLSKEIDLKEIIDAMNKLPADL